MDRASLKSGQVFLALVFFIGGLLAVAGVLVAFLTLSYIDTGYGVAASFKADAAATAGADDAILQLDRNAAFNTNITGAYTVTSGTSTSATVTVIPNLLTAGIINVLSVATVSGHTRKISAVVSESSSTGQVSVVSWSDVQ
jgi:hypothetical protein